MLAEELKLQRQGWVFILEKPQDRRSLEQDRYRVLDDRMAEKPKGR